MIDPRAFHDACRERGIRFFAGVPDSLLKDFCACVAERASPAEHVIAANEGNAVALAAGHYLATGGVGLVYLQNSGLGNLVNPLLSLADPDVYAIPEVLLIGWRGEPGIGDEPQHQVQGRLTLPLLETMGIPYRILPEEETNALDALDRAIAAALERSGPAALVARKGVFSAYPPQPSGASPFSLTREGAIRLLADRLDRGAVVVATTGKASRELFEYRAARGGPTGRDFLTVGSMGHASQIALGIALARSDREIWCLDGDGAVIMHMGALAVIGSLAPRNFRHVVFNNGAHDSVGGQPTAGLDIDLPRLAAACGYRFTASVATAAELEARWKECARRAGPVLLEIRVRRGARSDLGRPSGTPVENRDAFQRFLRE